MFSKILVLIVSVVFTILVTACGGGSGSSQAQPSALTSTLTGTAAAGLPILGTVYLKDVNSKVISGPIDAKGTYNIDVSSLTPPIRLKAEGVVAGKHVKYYSYASAEDVNGTINITPFTDLIVANVAGELAANFFDNNQSASSSLDAVELDTQKEALQTKLQYVFAQLGVESSVDLLKTSFSTDHSGLDAALDILKFETDPQTNIATITNILNNAKITDDINNTTDNSALLAMPVDGTTSITDLQKIFAQIDILNGYFKTGLPSDIQMNALVDDNFLNNDENKAAFVSNITTSSNLIGSKIQAQVEDINTTTGLADVTLHIYKGTQEIDKVKTRFKGNSTTWLLYGNQRIVDLQAEFVCDKTLQENGSPFVSCGTWLSAVDHITTNNNSSGALLSGKVYVERNGTAVPNTTVYLKNNGSGELWPYDQYFIDHNSSLDDYIAFDDNKSFSPAALAVGDQFVFELYSTELNTSSPNVPTVSGTPVQTYKSNIIAKTPTINEPINSARFPVFSIATTTQLNTFVGGTLNIEVTNSANLNLNELLYYASDSITTIEQADYPKASNSFTLDLSNLDLTSPNFTQEIRAYSKVSDMQTFMSTYRANLTGDSISAPLTFTNAMVAGNTVYEVYFNNVAPTKTINSQAYDANKTVQFHGISGENAGADVNASWEILSGAMITRGTFNGTPFYNKHVITADNGTYLTTNCFQSSDNGATFTGCGIDYYFTDLNAAQNFQLLP